jgi:phospholipid transport system substrate-binding protein
MLFHRNDTLGSWLALALCAALLALTPVGVRAESSPSADGARPDAAAQGDPMATVKATIDDATAIFRDKSLAPADREAKLRAVAARYFDFRSMARSAVGYHWRDLTPAQREEFVPLFTNFIEDVFLSRIENYSVEKIQQNIETSHVQFIRQTLDDPDYSQVFSTVTLKTQPNPIQVNYMLHRRDGRWRIYDVHVDAISVIANYRNQFNRVINNQGYDKLVSILRAKQKQLSPALAN